MSAGEWEIVPLRRVKFTTTGDHIFYVNDAEYEVMKEANDPHIIFVD